MSADETLHPEQFHVRTNIGAKAGSQGTLFQGGYPKNWPRGYTPERMREVVRATVHSGLDPSRQHVSRAAESARVRDVLARSTVPVEHLQHVGWYVNSGMAQKRDAGGYYNPPAGHSGRADIHIAPGEFSRDMTPIHEVGHHVSHTVERTTHSQTYDDVARGTEEGYAENYAETHFRDRRGKQQRSDVTSGAWSYGKNDPNFSQHAFSTAFNKKRKESPLAPKPFDPEVENRKQLPPEHIEGQLPLLSKVTSYGGFDYAKMEDKKSTNWDYTLEDQKEKGLKRERG